MRFVILAIVLLFPLLDLVVTARFARWTGVPMWMWLAGSAIGGLWVLTHERHQFRARTLAAFNAELFPDRWEAAYTLGRAHEGLADTTAAVAQYRRVLEAVPNLAPARQRLDRLTRRPP